MKATNLQQALRELGYKLAVRELHGENSKHYQVKREEHKRLLNKLYSFEKRS